MKLILGLLLTLSATTVLASYEEAQTKYKELRSALTVQHATIDAETEKQTEPVTAEVIARKAEREKCTTFACAEKLDQLINRLNQKKSDLYNQAQKQKNRLTSEATVKGQELAIDAYITEASELIKTKIASQVLSEVGNQPCQRASAPYFHQSNICKMVIYEFKKDGFFYQTKIYYGMNPIITTPTMQSLDNIFSLPQAEFLNGTFKEGYAYLSSAFVQGGSFYLQPIYEDNMSQYKFSFMVVSFFAEVKRTP